MLKSKIENKGLLTPYYRKKSSGVWHFHPSCPHFEDLEKDEDAIRVTVAGRPSSKELCNLCRSKEKRERRAGD
jgi:hypothetical protein